LTGVPTTNMSPLKLMIILSGRNFIHHNYTYTWVVLIHIKWFVTNSIQMHTNVYVNQIQIE